MSRGPAGDRPNDPRSRPGRPAPTPPPDAYDLTDEPTTFQPAPRPMPSRETRRPLSTNRQPGPSSAGRSPRDPSTKGSTKRDRYRETRGPGWLERIVLGSVSSGSLALFCRHLASYLDAGVDLLKSLGALGEQFQGTALGPVIERVRQGVKGGLNLSEAMAREPQAFDNLSLSMVRVAEAHGGIPEVLRQLAHHYESRQRLFRQARSALLHPTLVIAVAFIVGGLLSYFVLPALVGILKDMTRGRGGVDLPLPTRLLMAFSDFVVNLGWWLVPLIVVGGVFVLFRFYRTSAGKNLLDRVALTLPVFGKLIRMIDTTRFARTLSTLLEAGVPVGDSLTLTSKAQMTAPYRQVVAGLRRAVMEGHPMSDGLRASGRFPVDVIERVSTGEETGQLPEMLDSLADDYEEQTAMMVKNLGTLVQPLITLGLGAVVLFIAIAFVMAYVSILSGLGSGL